LLGCKTGLILKRGNHKHIFYYSYALRDYKGQKRARVVRTFENYIPGFPGGKWMIPGVKLKKGCQIPGVFYAGFPVGHCVVYNSNAMIG